jgi:hypothetical protein
VIDSLPRDDESAEDYARRIRSGRRRGRLIVFGVIAACIAVIGIYSALTAKPIGKIGETCGGAEKIECEGHAWCALGDGNSGRCVQACAPNIDDHCPPGTSCQLFDTVGKFGQRSGNAFACQRK